MKKCIYDSDYFERGVEKGISGYENYRWLPDLTNKSAESIVKELNIEKSETILDFGCAKGYLVKAFRNCGYESYGCDISKYAVNSSLEDTRPFLTIQEDPSQSLGLLEKYDWIVSKDVLEHVSYETIDGVLQSFKNQTDNIFIVVPLGDGEKYIIEDYENDVTHVIRENVDWWLERCKAAGFTNLSWSYTFPCVKENWIPVHKEGNLFIFSKS